MSKFILITLLLAFTVACSKGKERDQDIVLESYRLIDAQRSDEAIYILENALKADPANREYRVTLASAYAHYAGIKIQKFVPMIQASQQFSNIEKNEENEKKNSEINNKNDLKESKSLTQWVKVLSQTSIFLSIYSKIPTIENGKLIYLRQAIKEYDHIKSMTPSDSIYRFILRIIYIKHMLNNGPKTTSTFKTRCAMKIEDVNKYVLSLGKEFIYALDDLSIAHPKKSEKIVSIKEKVADSLARLSFIIDGAAVIDEASLMFLNEALIQQGLSEISKCEEKNY